MNRRKVKGLLDKTTRFFGFELHRYRKSRHEDTLPILFEDPLEALLHVQRNRIVAFKCPLKFTKKLNGLSYGPNSYHPFVETLKEYREGEILSYNESILKRYYDIHQPKNAFEAMIGFKSCPKQYKTYPAHVYRMAPWEVKTAKEIDQMVKRFTKKHSLSHGNKAMTLNSDGYQYHGPVSNEKGELEYKRLIRIYESLKKNGYNRLLGHANFVLLKRGKSVRFLSQGSGNHRTAAMSALGYESIPATFYNAYVVDIDMVEYWPKVCNGLWTRKQATDYFDYLFDFNSRDWAQKNGLLYC